MSEQKYFTPQQGVNRRRDSGEKSPSTPNNKTDDPDEGKMTRRGFVGLGLAVAAGLALSKLKFMDQTETPKEGREKIGPPKDEEEHLEQLRMNNENIETEDIEIIGKTFSEQIKTQSYITLDESTQKANFRDWSEKYAPDAKNYNYTEGILQGLERMRPWANEIKKIFASYRVPEEFIYLAIAESHFKTNAVSKAKAVGPYQIMKETSQLFKDFKMTVNKDYDERLDPLKSAELCAKHLRYSYERLGNNWKLAVLAYNGGFTEGFLKFLPEKEKQMPPEHISIQETGYEIKKGETLSQVASEKKTSLTLLWKKNALTDEEKDPESGFDKWIARMEKAHPGSKINIPQERKITLTDFYQWLEGEINKEITEELSSSTYEAVQGDTMGSIAERFHMDPGLLKSLNHNMPDESLRAGQELHIPSIHKNSRDILMKKLAKFSENINYPAKFYAILKIIQDNKLDLKLENTQRSFLVARLRKKGTLKEMAKHEQISLKDLMELNPAIKNSSLSLPVGFQIRVPNTYTSAKAGAKKIG